MSQSGLTVFERILLAAGDLQDERGSFSAEDLVVRAWQRFPDQFGLQGYADDFPDSNRVFTKIMGSQSTLRKKGYLEKVGSKRYRLTQIGRFRLEELVGSPNGSLRLAFLDRPLASVLKRLLTSPAFLKFTQTKEDLTFSDVCSFWNISPRSTARQLMVRRGEADKVIELALGRGQEGPLTLPGEHWSVSKEEIEALRLLSDYIETRFKTELDIIRARDDERKL